MSNTAEHKTNELSEAEAVAEEFRDYAYIVSHDLGAPVRAMVEFSKILASDHGEQLDEEGKEFLGIIVENGTRLQAMMAALLDYSRLNTMAKPFTKVDSSRIFENCCAICEDTITQSGARIKAEGLPVIHADADQCIQLFSALLDNALKFCPQGQAPDIEVDAVQQGNRWQFTFADKGIGMDPQFTEKIFGLFCRLHTADEYPGLGAGLTLARKIVRRHGGDITCQLEPGQYTRFIFTLPAYTDQKETTS